MPFGGAGRWNGLPFWVQQGSTQGASSTEQVIGITDIISEGPIAGLVKGGGSIFLNNDSLFTDEETIFASTVGLTTSSVHTSGIGPTIVINDFDKKSFDFSPSQDELRTSKRFICIHNHREFSEPEGGVPSANTSDQYIFNASESQPIGGAVQPAGFKIVIDGDFSVFPDGAIVDKRNFTLQNITDSDGLITLHDRSSDRKLTGFPIAINTAKTKLTVKVLLPNLDNHPWVSETTTHSNGNVSNNIKIKLSIFKGIQSISGNTITLNSNVGFFTNKRFSLTKPQYNDGSSSNSYNRKIRSSTYQFAPGVKDQAPLRTLAGTPGSSTVALPGLPNLELGVVQTITHTGAQAGEIDEIQLLFRYNSGLYTINTENGDKEAAGAGYVIKLEIQTGISGGNITWEDQGFLQGNMEMTTGAYSLRNQLLNGYSGTQPGTGSPVNLQQIKFDGPSGPNTDVLVEGTPIFGHGGKHIGPVSFTHTINLEEFQPYSGFRLKVCRITASQNSTDDAFGRAHTWGNRDQRTKLGYRGSDVDKWQAIQAGGISGSFGIIKEKLNFPYTSLANVTFSSKQFDSVPTRMYECYGMLVRVPSNYTTREEVGAVDTPAQGTIEQVGGLPGAQRLYSGLFTGQFREEKVWTDNPAWIFYDILTNNRYGVGDYVQVSDIDIYSLYKVARYCDELVADGKGGVEPRFRANLYLQKATEVFKVMKDMATIFRGMLYWMDGQLTPVIDEAKAPTYTFNRSNVVDGAFSYEQTGTKTRTNQVVVQWNNPENDYKLEPLFVEDRENIVKTGQIVKSESVAFGCTSEGQAIRYGRWKLWTALNQTEIVSFKSALNAAFISPGDIVNIQDNHDYGFSFGGRLSNASFSGGNTTLTLDRDIAVDPETGTDTNIGNAGTYTLALLVAERKVVAAKDCKIWDSSDLVYKNFKKGDVVTKWWNGTSQIEVDQPTGWSDDQFEQYTADSWTAPTNIPSSEDQPVPLHLEYADAHRIQEVTCTADNPNGNVLTIQNPTVDGTVVPVFANQTEADRAVQGSIWALKDENETTASYKTYKVLNIVHEDDNSYAITAVEYFDAKFDIIETNFTTALPDPLFPVEDPETTLPGPSGLRVIRAPRPAEAGEEIIIKWDPPSGLASQDVAGYSVSCNIPGVLEEQTTAETVLEFDKVPDGKYTVSVQAYSTTGKYSRPSSITFFVYDVYGGTAERYNYALKGGKVSSPVVITNVVGDKKIKFENDPLFVLSHNDTSTVSKSVAINLGLDFDILGKFTSKSWWEQVTVNGVTSDQGLFQRDAFVFVSDYEGTPSLKLVNYASDKDLNIDYWYDQTKFIEKKYNENETTLNFPNNPDIWTAQNGQVTVENNSAKVTGTSTAFLSQYGPTNLIKFNDGMAANVAYVEDDECLYIDRVFTFKTHSITTASVQASGNVRYTAPGHDFVVGDHVTIENMSTSDFNSDQTTHHSKFKIVAVEYNQYSDAGALTSNGYFEIGGLVNSSGQPLTGGSGVNAGANATTAIGNGKTGLDAVRSNHFRDGLNLDYSRDFLLGKISSTGAFTNFCVLDPDIGRPRALVVDCNFATLNYDTTTVGTTTTNELQTAYPNIILSGTAIGFQQAQIKVTGDFLTGSAYSADADFVDVPNFNTSQFTKQLAGPSTTSSEKFTYATPQPAGSPLEFTVTAREKNDPNNTAKQVTQVFKIFRVRDGASGTEGRTVSVLGNDSSVVYDDTNANPNPSSIVFTAKAFNFPTDAFIQFKDHNGNILQTYSQVDSNGEVTYTLDASSVSDYANARPSPDNRPKSIEVEASLDVTPKVASATDSTPILYISKFSKGLQINFPNNTVALASTFNGTTSGSTIPGSTGQMEVFFGNTVGKYVGTNNGTLNHNSSALQLNEGEWYVSDVQDSDANLVAGAITYTGGANGDQIITIADAVRNGELSGDSETITWTITGRNAEGLISQKVTQTIFKNKTGDQGASVTGPEGDDGFTISGAQTYHLFVANTNGIVSAAEQSAFSTGFVVKKGGTTFNFASTGTTANTYGILIQNETNCSASVNSTTGQIVLDSNSDIFTSGAVTSASFDAVIQDRADGNSTITLYTIRFEKVNSVLRPGGGFSFSGVGTTHGNNWASSSLTTSTAREAASRVIGVINSSGVQTSTGASPDGHIAPNDRVTFIQGTTVATRIYVGSRTNQTSNVSASSWSTVVTEEIDGSLLVNGTVSAETLAANTTISKDLFVGERLTIGTSGSEADGKIHSRLKQSFNSNNNNDGFYMDGSGNFVVGNSTNFIRFTPGTNGGFSMGGNATIQGQPGVGISSASFDSSGNLIITKTDNTSFTVTGGSARAKVVAIYASTANNNNSTQSYTQGNREFVTFLEYTTASPPTLPVSGQTFIKLTGEDGGGVQPIYATSSSGASASLTQGTRTFVHFHEYTAGNELTQDSQIASLNLPAGSYIQVEGTGTPGSSFITRDVTPGSLNTSSQSNLNSAFAAEAGRSAIANDILIVVQGASGSETSSAHRYNGSSWVSAALFITGDTIVDGTITASELQISNNGSGSEGIFMNGDSTTGPVIEIRDGTALRVKLGRLN